MTKARGKSLRAFQGTLKKTKIQGRVLILSGPGARRAARDDMRSGNAAGDRGTQQRARGANQPARAGGLAAPQRAGRGGQSRFARGAGWEEASGGRRGGFRLRESATRGLFYSQRQNDRLGAPPVMTGLPPKHPTSQKSRRWQPASHSRRSRSVRGDGTQARGGGCCCDRHAAPGRGAPASASVGV